MAIPPVSPKCQATAGPVQVTTPIHAAINRHFDEEVLKRSDEGSIFYSDRTGGFTLNNAKNPPFKGSTKTLAQCEVKARECLAFRTLTLHEPKQMSIGITTIQIERVTCCPDAASPTGEMCQAVVALPKESVRIFPPEKITIMQLALFGMSPEEQKRGTYSTAELQAARQLRSAMGLIELCSLMQSI